MVDRFLSPPTILTHPLTLQSTIPPFFQHFFVFILASSGFTPFFDPPTAVKEQQRMQDVGSDSGDSSGYLRIPATLQWIESSGTKFLGIPTTLPCSYWRGPAHWSGGLHALDTMEIKLACCACGGYNWRFYNAKQVIGNIVHDKYCEQLLNWKKTFFLVYNRL